MNSKLAAILGGMISTPPAASIQSPAGENVLRIPVDEIRPDPNNARKTFTPDSLAALADSIKRNGQLQTAVAWHNREAGYFQLVAGERRLRACQLAGIKTLLCLVLPREAAEQQREEIGFTENTCRDELTPLELAAHWQQLAERWKCSGREVARRVGVAPSTMSKVLRLLCADDQTREAIAAGELTATAAYDKTKRRASKRRLARRKEFPSGVIQLRRGHTLADLHADLGAALAGQPPQIADGTGKEEAA